MQKFELEIETDDVPRAQNALPDRVRDLPRDIPIVVKKPTRGESRRDDGHYDGPYSNDQPRDCVHAGDGISTGQVDEPRTDVDAGCWDRHGHQTVTTVVVRDGERYLMTCRHGFLNADNDDDCGATNVRTAFAYSGSCDYEGDRNYIGRVAFADAKWDVALIETSDGTSSKIRNVSSQIVGYATEDGIDQMAENDTPVYKYGAKTGRTSGYVEGVETRPTCRATDEWVKLTTMTAGGDSGAPHYAIRREYDDDPALLIGHHVAAEYDGDGDEREHVRSWTPPAFKLVEDLDIHPDRYNSCS